jgi:hypothetical protein
LPTQHRSLRSHQLSRKSIWTITMSKFSNDFLLRLHLCARNPLDFLFCPRKKMDNIDRPDKKKTEMIKFEFPMDQENKFSNPPDTFLSPKINAHKIRSSYWCSLTRLKTWNHWSKLLINSKYFRTCWKNNLCRTLNII